MKRSVAVALTSPMYLYHLICFEFYLSFPDEFSYIFSYPGIFQLFVGGQLVGQTTVFCFLLDEMSGTVSIFWLFSESFIQ